MPNIRYLLPSIPLREYVRGYVFRDVHLHEAQVVRPVSAESDPLLVFTLRDAYAAFEYEKGRSRTLPDALVVGPQSRRMADLQISGHHQAFSVCFQPAGVYRLFGIPGCELVNRAEDAAQILDPAIAPLLDNLRNNSEDVEFMVRSVEAYLLRRLSTARSSHPVHVAALELRRSNGLAGIADLVQHTGHSVRHFDRAFLSQFGMTPKRYARVNRFGFALRLKLHSPHITWTEVSQEAGYFDQNHLVKDFRSLVGAAPGPYLKAITASPEPLRSGSFWPGRPMSVSY